MTYPPECLGRRQGYGEGRLVTTTDFLSLFDSVRQRGSRWSARCPGHVDQSPSLSIAQGDRGILVRCFAGCSLQEICKALGIRETDLFFDALDADPSRRREAAQERERRRKQQAAEVQQHGRRIDALKAADYHIRSRYGLDISGWSDQKLDDELIVLADAYALLASEDRDG